MYNSCNNKNNMKFWLSQMSRNWNNFQQYCIKLIQILKILNLYKFSFNFDFVTCIFIIHKIITSCASLSFDFVTCISIIHEIITSFTSLSFDFVTCISIIHEIITSCTSLSFDFVTCISIIHEIITSCTSLSFDFVTCIPSFLRSLPAAHH